MAAMTPARVTERSPELWDRVQAQVEVRASDHAEFREALVDLAVGNVAACLADHSGLKAFITEAAADEDSGWLGACFQAKRLGRQDSASLVVLSLLSEKTTSGEADSAYFRALGSAAAELWGVDVPAPGGRAAELLDKHRALLKRFIDAQRALTADLLAGITQIVLHRGDAVADSMLTGQVDPALRPLASFTIDSKIAGTFATRKASQTGGRPIVYSAHVPVDRLVATPATGSAAVHELEVVVGAANPRDLVNVTEQW